MSEYAFFYHIKYLVLILTGTLGMLLISFSPKEIFLNLKLALNGHKAPDDILNRGKGMWTRAARNALLLGTTGLLIELLFFFHDVTATGSSGIPNFMFIFATSLLPVIYGLILACVPMILAWRTAKKISAARAGRALSMPHNIYWKIAGYAILVIPFCLNFIYNGLGRVFVSIPLMAIIFGGTILICFITRNTFAATPSLGILGFIVILLGISKILYAMAQSDISAVAAPMISSVLALFYSFLGILVAGVPLDDHQFCRARQTPLINKTVYIMAPIITVGIYLFIFIMVITPVAKS